MALGVLGASLGMLWVMPSAWRRVGSVALLGGPGACAHVRAYVRLAVGGRGAHIGPWRGGGVDAWCMMPWGGWVGCIARLVYMAAAGCRCQRQLEAVHVLPIYTYNTGGAGEVYMLYWRLYTHVCVRTTVSGLPDIYCVLRTPPPAPPPPGAACKAAGAPPAGHPARHAAADVSHAAANRACLPSRCVRYVGRYVWDDLG